MRRAYEELPATCAGELYRGGEDRGFVSAGCRVLPAHNQGISDVGGRGAVAVNQSLEFAGRATRIGADHMGREGVEGGPARRYDDELCLVVEHRLAEPEVENRQSLLGIGPGPHDRACGLQIVERRI